jgi:DNA-binding transcriptional LysR family regulator
LGEEPEMIIMHERVSATRRQAERSFAENRCTLKILMKKNHAETVKLLVQHGEGVALVVRKAVIHELQEVKLVTPPSKITRSSQM